MCPFFIAAPAALEANTPELRNVHASNKNASSWKAPAALEAVTLELRNVRASSRNTPS